MTLVTLIILCLFTDICKIVISMSGAERTPALTITDYQGQTIEPGIAVYLPHNLTVEEFLRLLPSHTSERPAFTFSALDNWLSKLQKSLKLQEDEQHPFHKHPYRLLEIDIQAVDWFWRNRKGHEDKLGFMKIQAKIETDPYEHVDGDKKDVKPDWIPGAVFLRGGSVAILVCKGQVALYHTPTQFALDHCAASRCKRRRRQVCPPLRAASHRSRFISVCRNSSGNAGRQLIQRNGSE